MPVGSQYHVISDTTPAAASTAVGDTAAGLDKYDSLLVIADLVGATGGTLDIYLQVTKDNGTTWYDYAHFAQLAAGAAAIKKMFTVSRAQGRVATVTVGSGTSPALAVDTVIGGEWGDRMRAVYVAGASTSAGAAITITIVGTRVR